MENEERIVTLESDGSMELGNVISEINVNKGNYRANRQGTAHLPDFVVPSQIVGMVKTIRLNGETYGPADANHNLDLPDLVYAIVIDGETTVVQSDGSIDITGALETFVNQELTNTLNSKKYVRTIRLNGTTYRPNTAGLVDLGTIEGGGDDGGGGDTGGGGGECNCDIPEVYTGTTPPSTSLGEDKDFYYQFI